MIRFTCGNYPYAAGDRIVSHWSFLPGVPGRINKVFSTGDIDAVFDPKDVQQANIPSEGTLVITEDNYIHVTLEPHEFEVFGRKVQVD